MVLFVVRDILSIQYIERHGAQCQKLVPNDYVSLTDESPVFAPCGPYLAMLMLQALMRQQSDGVAQKTAAAALLTVQSGNDRTAANNRPTLNIEEVLQTSEDAGVLAAVNALKREQSLRERDELAMRNLAKQYRPNEEIDQFAKEVIPSPSGPHRPAGPNEWDK